MDWMHLVHFLVKSSVDSLEHHTAETTVMITGVVHLYYLHVSLEFGTGYTNYMCICMHVHTCNIYFNSILSVEPKRPTKSPPDAPHCIFRCLLIYLPTHAIIIQSPLVHATAKDVLDLQLCVSACL